MDKCLQSETMPAALTHTTSATWDVHGQVTAAAYGLKLLKMIHSCREQGFPVKRWLLRITTLSMCGGTDNIIDAYCGLLVADVQPYSHYDTELLAGNHRVAQNPPHFHR